MLRLARRRPLLVVIAFCSSLFLPGTAHAALSRTDIAYGAIAQYRVKLAIALPGYSDSRPVGFDRAGHISGNGSRDGSERCIFYDGAKTTDITPDGAESCTVTAMSRNGTVVGHFVPSGQAEGTEGFIYRSSRFYAINGASDFTAIDSHEAIAGKTRDGRAGLYDPYHATWTPLVLDGQGCRMSEILALNSHGSILGEDTCDGSIRYETVTAGHVAFLHVPNGLTPTGLYDGDGRLVLSEGQWGGRAYLWRPDDGAPLDLGSASRDKYGTYVPVAGNGSAVVGQDYGGFFSWIWEPATGMRSLDDLFGSRDYFQISPAAIDEAGEILCSAFTFDSGSKVWLVLSR